MNQELYDKVDRFSSLTVDERCELVEEQFSDIKAVLPDDVYVTFCDIAVHDSSPSVRAAMALQGFTSELQNDPSPVVQEAIKEYNRQFPERTKTYSKDNVIDV